MAERTIESPWHELSQPVVVLTHRLEKYPIWVKYQSKFEDWLKANFSDFTKASHCASSPISTLGSNVKIWFSLDLVGIEKLVSIGLGYYFKLSKLSLNACQAES